MLGIGDNESYILSSSIQIMRLSRGEGRLFATTIHVSTNRANKQTLPKILMFLQSVTSRIELPHVHLLLWRSLTVFSWRVAATRPTLLSVSVVAQASSFSKLNCSFSVHSRRLTSIELLSWTNNQPPVWMNSPLSLVVNFPSPAWMFFTLSSPGGSRYTRGMDLLPMAMSPLLVCTYTRVKLLKFSKNVLQGVLMVNSTLGSLGSTPKKRIWV
ncbi:hypothetical protein FGO68_gene9644 [Halteria grandinella]|uniref:Uncharacterized protein n=1 Tax=Halteria grandinella TaxID=5974 RepID=A0A8J8P301_HALGN|nr:hypothetical protein FGO68_gene9644 [Halteria grandinella]